MQEFLTQFFITNENNTFLFNVDLYTYNVL